MYLIYKQLFGKFLEYIHNNNAKFFQVVSNLVIKKCVHNKVIKTEIGEMFIQSLKFSQYWSPFVNIDKCSL